MPKRRYSSYRRGTTSRARKPYRKAYRRTSAVSRSYPRYRGRGDYVKEFRGNYKRLTDVAGSTNSRAMKARGYRGAGLAVGTALGSTIGTMIAPGVGTALGAGLGGGAGYLADKIFGWGDY